MGEHDTLDPWPGKRSLVERPEAEPLVKVGSGVYYTMDRTIRVVRRTTPGHRKVWDAILLSRLDGAEHEDEYLVARGSLLVDCHDNVALYMHDLADKRGRMTRARYGWPGDGRPVALPAAGAPVPGRVVNKTTTYRVWAAVRGTKYLGKFEAPSAKEAADIAINESTVSMCHRCATECEDPELEVSVSKAVDGSESYDPNTEERPVEDRLAAAAKLCPELITLLREGAERLTCTTHPYTGESIAFDKRVAAFLAPLETSNGS